MTPISTKLHFMPLRLLGQVTGAEIKAGKDIVPSGSINQFFQDRMRNSVDVDDDDEAVVGFAEVTNGSGVRC
ncbi:unnamed protein product [Rhizophagus irregularis]|nr:unnamed protein product [Rhizophagus irregularis]CAB4418586.1 unnamed protein product [Rhizophagus irregularis]